MAFLTRAQTKSLVIVTGGLVGLFLLAKWLKSATTPTDDDVTRSKALNDQIKAESPPTFRLIEEEGR